MEAIETILATQPDLRVVLIGDTGQHDPHIYAAIVQAHPNRIARVILRRPNRAKLPSEIIADIAKIKDAGVPVASDYDYRAVLGNIS